jgi:hypothetical protein
MNLENPQELSLEIVYTDPDLIELEAIVRMGYWGGRVRAYTRSENIDEFSKTVLRFSDGATSTSEFTAGADTGIGLIVLRFYRIDRMGHIACQITLASGEMPTDHRPEQVSRLAIELRAESWAVVRFARELAEMVRVQAGRTSLPIEPENQ